MKKLYVAVDLGGTRCRILVADSPDVAGQLGRDEFLLSHAYEQDMRTLIAMIRTMASGAPIAAIGLSVPGDLNAEKTAFVDPSDNLLEWSDEPVKTRLEQEFRCPVFLENDGVAAGLGEAYFGRGKGKDFTFVIWGTGIGGSTVQHSGGKIVATTLDWYRYLDHWEQLCGGNKLRQRYGKAASELTEDEWRNVMIHFRQELASFIKTTNTKSVIFGGGIAIKQRARLQAVASNFEGVELAISPLGEDAGLYGALAVIQQEVR